MTSKEAIQKMMWRTGFSISLTGGMLTFAGGAGLLLGPDLPGVPIAWLVWTVVVLVVALIGWQVIATYREGGFSREMRATYPKPTFVLPHVGIPLLIISVWIVCTWNGAGFGVAEIVAGLALVASGMWTMHSSPGQSQYKA